MRHGKAIAAFTIATVVAMSLAYVETRKPRPLAVAALADPVNPVPAEDALQSLLDGGGVVQAPGGTVVLTKTLRLTVPGTTLRGEGPARTTFVWKGPRDQPAIECRAGSWWFKLEEFGVEYPDGRTHANYAQPGHTEGPFDEREETVGLAFGVSDNVPGTCTGGGRVTRVGVSGFDHGVRIGRDASGGTCASEIVFDHLQVAYSKFAVLVDGWNALNFRFQMLVMTHCWNGVYIPRGASVSINSGAATNVGYYRTPYDFGAVLNIASGGSNSIRDFRSEGSPSGCLVRNQVAEASTMTTVENCESSGESFERFPDGIKDSERVAVRVAGNASVAVRQSRFLDAGLASVQTFMNLRAGSIHLSGNHYLTGHEACKAVGERPENANVTLDGNRAAERYGVPIK